MCIQLTITGQQASGMLRQVRGPASRCPQVAVALPVQIRRTRSGYLVTANAHTRLASGRQPLVFGCRVTRTGMVISVRARPGKLRRVIGSSFRIGYSNHTSKRLTVQATFRFH